MREKKSSKGITLIALIITIIILLILAGIITDILIDGDLTERAEKTSANIDEDIENQQSIVNNIVWEDIDVPNEDEPGNSVPSLKIGINNLTRTSVTIRVNAVDEENDPLNYTLEINGKTYGPSTTNIWNITELSQATTYPYTITVTDGINTVTRTREIKTKVNQKPTVTATSSNVAATTAKITATGTDNDGDTLTYTLTINGKAYGTNTTGSWNVTGLAETTTHSYTVTATDGYDTVSDTGSFTTLTSNVAPVIATNSLSSRTTTSITISAKATDANGDRLIYRLYTSTTQNGTYTLKATSSSTAQNTQVTLTASSLSNYTTYWWYITVTDTKNTTTTSGKQSTNTYCPGTGYTCTTSSCSGGRYITCSGCAGRRTSCKKLWSNIRKLSMLLQWIS